MIDPITATNVDLRDIRVVQKVGGTIDDTELVDGLVLTQNVIKSAGGPTRMEKAKIGLIQFQLSPPKPDVRICSCKIVFIRSIGFLTCTVSASFFILSIHFYAFLATID